MITEETAEDVTILSTHEKQGIFKAAIRTRKVTLLPLAAKSDGLTKNDTLLLSLFPSADYTATIDRATTDVNGTVTVRGRIEGFPLGYIILSTHKGQSLVTINIPELGKQYAIQYDVLAQSHYLIEVDPAKIDQLEGGPSLTPPPPEKTETEILPDPITWDQGINDPATINAMIVYTPAAKAWADTNGGGINNVIAQAMAKAQLVLDNSNTLVTIQLAHAQEVTYTESGASSTDLNRLTATSDGYLDEVHSLRDTYGADLVAMFTEVNDTGGLGWLLNSTSGSPTYAFCINRVQQVGWTYTQIHEMGHNMGLHHHKEQNFQPGPGLYSYSAGWRWTGTDSNRYCSVMTYESGTYFADGLDHTRVAYFSNPDIPYMNVATGHIDDGDNARNVREIKHVIAAYRDNSSYTLTVNSAGAAAVTISGSPGTYTGITNYSKTDIDSGTSMTLTAPDSVGSANFSSWSGCTSTSGVDCTVSMTTDKTVTATYTTPNTYSLNVNATGAASVAITSDPTTYAGTTNYSKTGITPGTNITLTAPVIANGINFKGWSGDCSGTANSASIIIDGDKTCIAVFQKDFPWPIFLPTITTGQPALSSP